MTSQPQPKNIVYVPVDRLRFDQENPRLPTTLGVHDERAIIGWMLQDASIIELMGSIGEQNYFDGEPLLVIPDTEDGYYQVVEGNRRLTAVKLLRNPSLAPNKQKSVTSVSESAQYRPENLPVIIYPNRREILDYLGYRHITGIKPWGSLEKARYLKQLASTVEMQGSQNMFSALAKIIGSRADYVARLLTSLSLFERIAEEGFFGIRGLDEESISFSILTTIFTYSNIPRFLGLRSTTNPDLEGLDLRRLAEVTSWLFEENLERRTRLGESRNLRDLNQVVASPTALAAFRDGRPLSEAVLLTEAPTEAFRDAIGRAWRYLGDARDLTHLLATPAASDIETLQNIRTLASDLARLVQARLADNDES